MFFEDGDYRLYRDLLAAETARAKVEVWAWVLMPNHVHLILVPADATGLAQALSRVHRRYAAFVNARARRTGHLVQERFGSAVMDEAHLIAALRYVSRGSGPGRARGEGRGLAVVEHARPSGAGR
jgi:putative transposase